MKRPCASSAFYASRAVRALQNLYRKDAENAEEAQRVSKKPQGKHKEKSTAKQTRDPERTLSHVHASDY
jgi:hypothetical protein